MIKIRYTEGGTVCTLMATQIDQAVMVLPSSRTKVRQFLTKASMELSFYSQVNNLFFVQQQYLEDWIPSNSFMLVNTYVLKFELKSQIELLGLSRFNVSSYYGLLDIIQKNLHTFLCIFLRFQPVN